MENNINSTISYTFKASALHKITHYQLADNHLIVRKVGTPDIRIPFSSILRLRLTHHPNRKGRDNYLCEITTSYSKYTIHSTSFEKLNYFIDQASEYKVFIKNFVSALRRVNPKVAIWLGINKVCFFLQFLLLMVAGYLLVFLFFIAPIKLDLLFFIKLLLLACITRSLLLNLSLHQPKNLLDKKIPASALPPEK